MSGKTAIAAARGASYLALQNLVCLTVQIIAFGLLARMITVTEMGLLTILTTALAAAQVVVNLGLPSIIAKLVAENNAQGKIRNGAAVFYISFFLNVLVSLAVAALILFTRFPAGLSGMLNSNVISAITVFLALDILAAYGNMTAAAISGLQKFRDLAIFITVFTMAKQALILYLVYLFHSLVGWVAATTTIDLLTTIITFAYLMKHVGPPTFNFDIKYLLKLSAPVLLSNMCLFGYYWFDRIFLIGFVDLTTLGIYGAATQAFGAYLNLINVLPIILIPTFAKNYAVDGRDSLGCAARSASKYVSFTFVPIAFALLAAARPAITIFVGLQYEGGAFPLGELAAFSVAAILAYPLSSVLIVLNETKLYSLTIIPPLIAGIGVGFLTISSLGVVAMSTARGLAMAFNLVLSVILLRRKLLVSFDMKALRNSIVASAAMALVMWLVQIVWYKPLLLPLYVFCGGVTYLVVLRVLRAVSKDDIDLLSKVFGQRFGAVVRLASYVLLP